MLKMQNPPSPPHPPLLFREISSKNSFLCLLLSGYLTISPSFQFLWYIYIVCSNVKIQAHTSKSSLYTTKRSRPRKTYILGGNVHLSAKKM